MEAKECNHDHKSRDVMSYNQAHAWAEKKIKHGAIQRQCPVCKLWFFKSEANDPKFNTWPDSLQVYKNDYQ